MDANESVQQAVGLTRWRPPRPGTYLVARVAGPIGQLCKQSLHKSHGTRDAPVISGFYHGTRNGPGGARPADQTARSLYEVRARMSRSRLLPCRRGGSALQHEGSRQPGSTSLGLRIDLA